MLSYSVLISNYDLSLILLFEITSCEYFDPNVPLSMIKHGFRNNHEQLLPLVFWKNKRSPSCLLFYVLPAAVCPHEMVMGWLHDFLKETYVVIRICMSYGDFFF